MFSGIDDTPLFFSYAYGYTHNLGISMINSSLKIDGYGSDLSINGVCIGDLSTAQHQAIEDQLGTPNYHSLEGVIVSHAESASTLMCQLLSGTKETIRPIIDGLCCYSAVNQGQLNPVVVDAVVAHLCQERLPTVPRSIQHKYMAAFLLACTEFTQMERVMLKVSGVEAWECSFKLARRWGYHCKGIADDQALVIGVENNFHGRSMAAISMSSNDVSRDGFGPFLPGTRLIPFNDIDALRAVFEKDHERICAFNAEPIQGEAGVIVPDEDYWPQVRALCDQYNILLVMDEVQTGYGRTGADFAHQLYGIKPDLMSCGKATGAGIVPLSFVAGRGDIIKLLQPGTEGSTFGGYPLACVVGVFAIKAVIDGQLTKNSKAMGLRLMSHFNEIKADFPDKVMDVRGKGLLTAIQFFDSDQLDGHEISLKLLSKGLYAKETHRHTIRVAPALSINAEKIDKIAEIIRKTISDL